ncbi:hypothetical protein L9F63_021166 [Diploptera punctata]|uniref:UDP-N-acetylglucosamine transferase subunit ALG14 n=1 Tax=Diploptera punctata TaxID=6984 RepID=A0AAD8EC89_DIPPU|nr:hypothetical protein L9F63_021166 [Diploptera punctata]
MSLITCIVVIVLLARLGYLLFKVHFGNNRVMKKRIDPVHTAIIIGSGGHTTEMLRLLKNVNSCNYSPRLYIVASTDTTSAVKIHELERNYPYGGKVQGTKYEIVKIPRSRHVGQSYITSMFTTLYSLVFSFPLMIFRRPKLILCNGPGTCIPICVVAFIMRMLLIIETKIVFVESICRVKSLSLTGKILLIFADEILVQWPELQEIYKRTKYIGKLV